MPAGEKKLVYILPEYRADIGSHFYHKYEFLCALDKVCDLFVLVEKGERPPGIKRSYLFRTHFLPFRAIESVVVFTFVRFRGFRIFWTHYSFFGAILAPFFGKSFYWNCGMPWLYKRGAAEEYSFRLALRRSFLVTGTEGLKHEYIKHYALRPDRVLVLPNWINRARFSEWRDKKDEARAKLGVPRDKKVIFFLHRLSGRKGADMIMPLAERLRGENVLFLVAGDGPLRASIKGENIRLLGEVPQRDVPLYGAAADIFFMPSEEEGFPHALLEAMALGLPMVASDVGGVRDIVPPSAQEFVVTKDLSLFESKIKMLLANPELYQKLSDDECAWVERYSLERVLQDFQKLVFG